MNQSDLIWQVRKQQLVVLSSYEEECHELAASVQERFLSDFRPSEELYDITDDPFELKNLASEKEYELTLKAHAKILENWIYKTDDKGQYPENEENLKFMLEIWGDHVVNPEYEILKKKYPGIAGSKKHILKAEYKKEKVSN